MSFLNQEARQRVKDMLRQLEQDEFEYLMADLYARQGASVSFDTASSNIDFVLEDPNDYTDTIFGSIGVNCLVLNRNISLLDIQKQLSSDLTAFFDEFYLCSTSENQLSSYIRSKLRTDGFHGDWFTYKNYSTICSLLNSYDNDYLVYVHYEVSPVTYSDGIRDKSYISDRFDLLGIAVSEYAINRIMDAANPLQYINMIEKFVLSECVGTGLIRDHINPIFDTNEYIQVAVQNGRPSQSAVESNIFKQ